MTPRLRYHPIVTVKPRCCNCGAPTLAGALVAREAGLL